MGIKRKIIQTEVVKRTIEDVFNEFITEKKALGLSKHTLKNYSQSFLYWYRHIVDMGYNLYIEDVTKLYFTSYSTTLIEEDKNRRTINHYLNHVRVFLYWCSERKYFVHFKCTMVKTPEYIKPTLNDAEKRLLIAKPREKESFSTWRTWAISNFILATGARASTVCNIKIDDIDFVRNEIYLNRTKNNRVLVLPLSPALKIVLKEYINTWRSSASDESWLFPNIGDEYLRPDALWQKYRDYVLERGITNTSVHNLRHTFALEYIRAGGNVVKLQKVLGHSKLDTTMRYVKLLTDDIKKDFDEFNPLDNIKKKNGRTHRVHRT